MKSFDEIENASNEELQQRIEEYVIKKAMKAETVRKSIRATLKHAENMKEEGESVGRIGAIEPIMKAMVVSASSELGGKLTDKEMKQLESIALRVIGEELGEE